MLNHQNFSYQNFALRNFWHCIFDGIIYSLEFVRICHILSYHCIMLRRAILQHFWPIKKDTIEDKELPDPSGPLSKVVPS